MGNHRARRVPIHRGLLWNGVFDMARETGSGGDPYPSQPYGRSRYHVNNKPDNRRVRWSLPDWYHRSVIIVALIGLIVLTLLAIVHGG